SASGAGWLLVRSPGRARLARALQLAPGRDTRLKLELEAGRPFVVEVRARGEDGELVPLAGATVLVGPADAPLWGVKTDAEGRATIADAPTGRLRVQVLARGYEPYVAESEADLLVRLRPVMGLRVRVLDEGQPRPRAQVRVSGLGLWPPRVVETGADGSVDIQGLAAGNYVLGAEAGDRVTLEDTAVELLGERGQREVTLVLGPGRFVEVRVEDERATPIVAAQLTFSGDGMGEHARRAQTNVAGRARLGPLASLEGFVQAAAPGYVERVVPSSQAELVIVLERAGIVSGRVVDEKGMPIAGAEVDVVGTDNHGMPIFVRRRSDEVQSSHFAWALESERRLVPAGELGVMLGPVPPIPFEPRGVAGTVGAGSVAVSGGFPTDDRGRFQVVDVPPGQIVVLGRHPDYLDAKSRTVTLAPAGRVEVEIVLGRGAPLRGRVLDHRDFPVGDARVTLSARGYERQVVVAEDGSFELGAAPRELSIRVTRASQPLRSLLAEQLRERDPAAELVLRLPAPRESSRVRVVDERGDGVGLAQIRVVSRDPRSPLEETRFSSDHGDVEFPDSRGLPVRVEVEASGYVERVNELVLGAEQTIRLARALRVNGRVTTARGRLPAAGAEIVLAVEGVERRTVASETGEYRFVSVPPGRASLRAHHAEHGRASTTVMVSAGVAGRDGTLPDLDLVPAVEVRGRVVDERGFPVAGAWVSGQPASVYVSRSMGYDEATRSDASGEFVLELDLQDELELFGAVPAVAGGYERLTRSGRDRIDGVTLKLEEPDLAPADELGTVLVSLLEAEGRIEVSAVARVPLGSKAELRIGDRLVEVEGVAPRSVTEARELLSGEPGSAVELVVERGSKRVELRARREAFLR
ncbi:MAG TPA: carboxypeptidase regulatory-like domain-containing protein, partial [Polyangiaceae bacterium]|nr:carboxypeptidase regulatory-like domain-containing protein [Polyangiaceae bacterium]